MDTWTQTSVKEGQNCVVPRQTHESVTKGHAEKWDNALRISTQEI